MRLDVRGVTAGYGDVTALRDVSLTVPHGRVAALLGPNGAGKSTLLSVVSGLLRPRAGEVLLDQLDVTSRAAQARVGLGVCHITEGRSVFPELTVQDNLRLFAARGQEAHAAERAIAAFPRLGQRRSQIAGTMSGGEQQMLALGRAYVRDAPLVLLDEVSLGLAPILVDEIFDFLRQLARGGTTILLVEQYVAKALDLADIVYVMSHGRIAFAGQPEEVRDGQLLAHYLGSGVANVV